MYLGEHCHECSRHTVPSSIHDRRGKKMGSQSCGSCYVRSIVDRMKPRCLEGKPRRRETNTVRTRSRAEARQGTLEDILYSPQSIDRMSLRSQNSIVRRVSFRLPDESDVFIIPARKDPDEYSTDDESTEDVSEEVDPKKLVKTARRNE